MGLFECVVEGCGKQKEIRIANVKPGHTTSCGCVGKELYKEYVQKRATNHTPPKIDPKRPQDVTIDATMEAAVAKERRIYNLWTQLYPDKPLRIPWLRVQMETVAGWTGGWMSSEEWDLVAQFEEIRNRRCEEIELGLEKQERRESAYARSNGGFRSEEQRKAWLRSENPRDRLEAMAAGKGESAKIAAEELKRLRDKERSYTDQEFQNPSTNIEIG